MFGQGAHLERAGHVTSLDAPYRVTCSDRGKLSLFAAVRLGDDQSAMATAPVQATWSKITELQFHQLATKIERWCSDDMHTFSSTLTLRQTILDDSIQALGRPRPNRRSASSAAAAASAGVENVSAIPREHDEPSPASKQLQKRSATNTNRVCLPRSLADWQTAASTEELVGDQVTIGCTTFYLRCNMDRCALALIPCHSFVSTLERPCYLLLCRVVGAPVVPRIRRSCRWCGRALRWCEQVWCPTTIGLRPKRGSFGFAVFPAPCRSPISFWRAGLSRNKAPFSQCAFQLPLRSGTPMQHLHVLERVFA